MSPEVQIHNFAAKTIEFKKILPGTCLVYKDSKFQQMKTE